ncbi:MAG: tyrosine-type recombinase/integrase [Candidatus Woesearchaeota archaeon]
MGGRTHKAKERKYYNKLEAIKTDKTITKENVKLINKFMEDISLGISSKCEVGLPTRYKYLIDLVVVSRWFNKSFSKVKFEDMKRIIVKLNNDGFKSVALNKPSQPYSEETKANIKRSIKKFWKWLYMKKPAEYQRIAGWIKTNVKEKLVDAVTRDEAKKLLSLCDNATERFLIQVLWDGGFRISELLNAQVKDLMEKKEGNKRYYVLNIHISKTRPRPVGLRLSTKEIEDWLHDGHPDRLKDNFQESYLFPLEYEYVRTKVKEIGKKAGIPLNPHKLRHSSCSYYCNFLTTSQMCVRYGWSFNSKSPGRYIHSNGVDEGKATERVYNDEFADFRTQLEEEREKVKELENKFEILHQAVIIKSK